MNNNKSIDVFVGEMVDLGRREKLNKEIDIIKLVPKAPVLFL